MRIKSIDRKVATQGRYSVYIRFYRDLKPEWENIEKHPKVEYDTELGHGNPILKTSAGTINFRRKCIHLMQPKGEDCGPLAAYALDVLNDPHKSVRWFEFKQFWRREVRAVSKLEKNEMRAISNLERRLKRFVKW